MDGSKHSAAAKLVFELEAGDRIRADGFRGWQINAAVRNLSVHHRMNRQGDNRQSGATEDGEDSKGFGEHEPWVGAEPTLLNSVLISDDGAQVRL